MSVTFYKTGEEFFHLIGTNGFHAYAKNERSTAAGSLCGQNLKFENFTSSFGRLRLKIALNLPFSIVIYFHAAATNPFAACSVNDKGCQEEAISTK